MVYLHFVFLVGVCAQQDGGGLDLVGEFGLGELGAKALQHLRCFLHHEGEAFDGLVHGGRRAHVSSCYSLSLK